MKMSSGGLSPPVAPFKKKYGFFDDFFKKKLFDALTCI
jgi:hypothetical protein